MPDMWTPKNVKDVVMILKKKFPNLQVTEAIELAEKILNAIEEANVRT